MLLGSGSDAGSRPGTPGSTTGGGGAGGRRMNLFEALLRSQSQAAWAEEGGGMGGTPTGAAGIGEGSVRGSGNFGGSAGAQAGMMSKSASMSDARSSFDSRQNSLSRQGGGEAGGARRWTGWAAGLLAVEVASAAAAADRGRLAQAGLLGWTAGP